MEVWGEVRGGRAQAEGAGVVPAPWQAEPAGELGVRPPSALRPRFRTLSALGLVQTSPWALGSGVSAAERFAALLSIAFQM